MSQKDKLGFKETLSPKQEISVKLTTQNDKLCPEISTIGQKLNNSFFISNAGGSLSQFPYLTSLGNTRKVNSLEGGGGKSRKYMNIKNRNNKNRNNKNKSNKNKRKSCKHIHR
jgi:hypothetical protein